MTKINVARPSVHTHEGAVAVEVNAYERLKRTVLACMLFENQFYEDGVKAVDRIKELCAKVKCHEIIFLALDAAQKYKLRHIPLLLIVEALKHPQKSQCQISKTVESIITRPDQMTDLLALYWGDGKKPIAHQLKRGLALAFKKFDAYQLAKYNRDNPIKLRDVLFMVHAKPNSEQQTADWKQLIDGSLPSPDTWEVRLSAGDDKKQSFHDLLSTGKMGKLAILRNLRNMKEAGIDKALVRSELERNMKEMLPFQYLAAARECPEWEDVVDEAMVKAAGLKPKLPGKTILLVDVSGSMDAPISAKSKMMRFDAACGLAILLRECCDDVHIISFSQEVRTIPPRHGMALRDAIVKSQAHGGTYLGLALAFVISKVNDMDRVIVITDEQTHDAIPKMPKQSKNYILNIASYENGIGSQRDWVTITGFSEASVDFIRELENCNG